MNGKPSDPEATLHRLVARAVRSPHDWVDLLANHDAEAVLRGLKAEQTHVREQLTALADRYEADRAEPMSREAYLALKERYEEQRAGLAGRSTLLRERAVELRAAWRAASLSWQAQANRYRKAALDLALAIREHQNSVGADGSRAADVALWGMLDRLEMPDQGRDAQRLNQVIDAVLAGRGRGKDEALPRVVPPTGAAPLFLPPS